MAVAVAVIVVVLAIATVCWLEARFAPTPVYDWPVIAYRLVLAVRSAVRHWWLRTIHRGS